MRIWATAWIFVYRLASQILAFRNLGLGDTALWGWFEWWAHHLGAVGHYSCFAMPTENQREGLELGRGRRYHPRTQEACVRKLVVGG